MGVQLLTQLNVILRNSGTLEALTRRLGRKLAKRWARLRSREPSGRTYTAAHDPIFRLQFLARLGIQSDFADLAALLLTPSIVTAFVWRDGRFALEGTEIEVLPSELSNVWLRFAILLVIRLAASTVARLWLERNMGRVMMCSMPCTHSNPLRSCLPQHLSLLSLIHI